MYTGMLCLLMDKLTVLLCDCLDPNTKEYLSWSLCYIVCM